MKNLAIAAVVTAMTLSLASCHLVKHNEPTPEVEEVELTGADQVDGLLQRLEGEIYMLGMVNHDVVTNVDAIIATEERISNIISCIEAKPDLLDQHQKERFDSLRNEYHKQAI